MHDIRLRGARTNNLKGVDVDLTAGELVAVTGVSGAGKSSLAIDTLYAEGQRRFVESFSPYARQFLERLERPPITELEPVAAAVAVDRRAPVKSSRSTVATMADLEPYLSALFTREALPMCPSCDREARHADPDAAAAQAIAELEGEKVVVTYPVRVTGTEQFLDVREDLARAGYRRLWAGGAVRDLDDVPPREAISGRREIAVVVDRFDVRRSVARRLSAALEEAWGRSGGRASIVGATSARGERPPLDLARGLSCPGCARTFQPPRPGLFSYQSPLGACPTCRGFGRSIGVDWDKVFPDPSRSLSGGAIRPWTGKSTQWERRVLAKYCDKQGIPMDRPWGELSPEQRERVVAGEGSWKSGRFPGVRLWFEWLESKTYKMHVRVLLARYRSYDACVACGGKRLSPESLLYRVAGLDLGAWHGLELAEARARLDSLTTSTGQGEIARSELRERLSFLERVGLGYLTLDRQARTLSGGEAQRVSLTSALGTSLTGALFVLDEPTVGLHPSDVEPLVRSMQELADRGNAVLVVEHDAAVIGACDRALEIGPGAGREGGVLVFDGDPREALARREALAAARPADAPRRPTGKLTLEGARANNLENLTVDIPLGVVVAVVGVSGSGKSTLAEDVLYRALARKLGERDVEAPGACDAVRGHESIRAVSLVDQAPLGRTSRGNPATYSGAWDRVRAMFAALPAAKARGLTPGHFSFNVALGRCEACAGEGSETIEMQFLADVRLTCATCGGKRFNDEVLSIDLAGRSVADVLALSVDDARALFEREAAIVRALAPLSRLGLGYLSLGQPLSTLSGGEAQRLKLARALAEVKPGALFVLDEPSAGLHPREIGHLLGALDALVSAGASVIVVEHDLDVIRAADWVIELGPGAGRHGGRLVAEGTVADVLRADTRTARALRSTLGSIPRPSRERSAASGPEVIEVVHAREHNLAEVSTRIPRGELCVVTGPSGSGKSTLAFDVVFAEGQRRFLETLTPYARQFLPTLPRPDVDRVTGVPPSIALEQRTTRAGPSSTVATVTEIAHYLRLLYAKVGDPHCPSCDARVDRTSPDEAFGAVVAERRARVLLAPAVSARKGTYLDVFTNAARLGIERAIADGVLVSTEAPPKLAKRREHSIDLVVYEGPLAALPREVFDRALGLGQGAVKLRRALLDERGERLVSTARTCGACGVGVPELDPRWFSFNTKQGRCAACEGSGLSGPVDPDAPDDASPCEVCGGSRLSPLPRAVRLAGDRYHEACARSVDAALGWARALSFEGTRRDVASAPLSELVRRLAFVAAVGLGYLSLDRAAVTLSGGEMQRLRLAAQLGSGLTGALYVLDEPTIGLHPRDTQRLLDNLRALVGSGSTVLMVEHDAETIRAADHLIDLGPGGGRHGGRIVAEGPPARVLSDPASPTGRALAAEESIARSREGRGDSEQAVVLSRPRAHNLKLDELRIPTGRLTVVAGVSGSGKSTLVRQILYPAVRRARKLVAPRPGRHERIHVPREIERAVAVDQSPIGRTPRSVPATFLGVWDEVRKLFACSPEAKVRGYTATRFSFNSARGGRCAVCEGQGSISHEMSFLPDVTTPCEACGAARFDPSTLEVQYLGLSVGEVLALSAQEAAEIFRAHPRIAAPLEVMRDLGVGYLQLGQGSHTLSGGEAQRLKLAAELAPGARSKGTLYVLDEPTTGLHLADVAKLIGVLDRLVERGDTLVVIEHHPAVIAAADWVVELGPDGGALGGELIAEGTPKTVSRKGTPTGRVLRELLGTGRLQNASSDAR